MKFVLPPLHMHKPPLQDDIKLESMLIHLISTIFLQKAVVGTLHNIKNVEENS